MSNSPVRNQRLRESRTDICSETPPPLRLRAHLTPPSLSVLIVRHAVVDGPQEQPLRLLELGMEAFLG